jgi:hypothetical protein
MKPGKGKVGCSPKVFREREPCTVGTLILDFSIPEEGE